MKEIIIEPREVREAANQFRELIRKAAKSYIKKEMSFPGGGSSNGTEYTIEGTFGKLLVNIPDKPWNERLPHLFVLNPKTKIYTSDLEINVYLGLNRFVSGCYVKFDEEISICHRGRFTIYKSPISKRKAFEYFEKRVITIEDGEKISEVIEIAKLSSPNLINQLAQFVKEVLLFKEHIKEVNES